MKQASQQDMLEQDLGKMEYTLRKAQAPSLYENHDIGFQVLEADDAEQQAVGIRVFRVGKDWLYAPIFFSGGQLKGDELLYVKSRDIFVPFEEEWVNFLMSREPLLLGEEQKGNFDATEPDLGNLANVPSGSGGFEGGASLKPASVQPEVVCMLKEASPLDLRGALEAADESAKRGFREFLLGDLKVAEYIVDRHDMQDLLDLVRPKEASAEDPSFGVERQTSLWDRGQLKVATSLNEAENPEEKSLILTQGYAAVDTRPEGDKAQLVAEDTGKFSQPAEGGFQSILTQDGPKRALIIDKNEPKEPDEWRRVPVILWDDKTFDKLKRKNLVSVNEENVGEWKKTYEALPKRITYRPQSRRPSRDSDESVRHYAFIGPEEGQIHGPVRIVGTNRLPDGQVKLNVRFGKDILITKSKGSLTEMDDQTVIPKTWKGFEVTEGTIRPKGMNEALMSRAKGVHIKSAGDGQTIIESSDGRDVASRRGEVIKVLMEKYALDEEVSKSILKDRSEGASVFWIKEAAPAGMPVGPPPAMGPAMGAMPPPGPAAPEAQRAMLTAQKAMERGQGEIVDAASLGSILSTSDSAQFVRKYLGDLLTAVDRCGRILFMIYWNEDEFEESFGRKDLDELIDDLGSAYRTLGKLVLDLKERISGPTELPIFD